MKPMDGTAQRTTLRLPSGSREGLVQGGRNRGLEARLFRAPDWVRMGRRDAQGRAPEQTRQMTLNVKTCSTEISEGCAREAGLNVGASPTRRVGLFTAEHDLNSVAARRGWKLRKMNRRAVTKVNHI